MTITVTAIPGGSTSDSYATDAQAQAFFTAAHISSAWDSALDPEQTSAMKTAALDLDRFIRQYSMTSILSQARAWPWDGGYDDNGNFLTAQTPDAGSGTTTGATVDGLKDVTYPDNYFKLGSLYIYATSDSAAPMTELKAVSAFIRNTGALTTAAFTVAIPDSANLWLVRPAPQWLIDAQCLQAYFILEDRETNMGAQLQAGIQSASPQPGGSISFRAINAIDTAAVGLCQAARVLIDRRLPRSTGVDRA